MRAATHDRPLPGDLVIANCNIEPTRDEEFAVFVYPNAKLPVAAPTFTAALDRAQHIARGQGATVQIWRLEPAGPSIFRKVED